MPEMGPLGGPPGPPRRGSTALLLLLAASARLYGALLVLYPRLSGTATQKRCAGTSGSFRGKGSRRGRYRVGESVGPGVL